MIVKHFEVNKFDINKFKFFLFYGKNEGYQNELIYKNFIENFKGQVIKYDENEFINSYETVVAEIMNFSLFENKKIIIISRATDKLIKYIEELIERNIIDTKIILKCGVLDKRSKVRNLFEKNKSLITFPFYEDTDKSLSSILINFLNENNIKMSREAINFVISRVNGERQNLKLELEKILNYSLSNKTINFKTVEKLTNLSENYNVNELANNYLSKDTNNVSKILNENNYSNEDCILILRTILLKSKKLLDILERYCETNDIDYVISQTKPPIFWKDKEKVKIQANSWKKDELKNKIYELNNIETIVKNNSKNSLNIVSDFIVNY